MASTDSLDGLLELQQQSLARVTELLDPLVSEWQSNTVDQALHDRVELALHEAMDEWLKRVNPDREQGLQRAWFTLHEAGGSFQSDGTLAALNGIPDTYPTVPADILEKVLTDIGFPPDDVDARVLTAEALRLRSLSFAISARIEKGEVPNTPQYASAREIVMDSMVGGATPSGDQALFSYAKAVNAEPEFAYLDPVVAEERRRAIRLGRYGRAKAELDHESVASEMAEHNPDVSVVSAFMIGLSRGLDR